MYDKVLEQKGYYWVEVTDPECFNQGQQLLAQFTGIYFRDAAETNKTYLLSQLKIFRMATSEELTSLQIQ